MKMQQTKSYWRMVAVAGVVGAFVASACVVTTSSDAGGAGGTETFAGSTGTTGGTTSAGATSGGSNGISGSTNIAGTNSVAGSGGAAPIVTPFQCDPANGKPFGTRASCAATAGNTCSECTAAHCCTEFSDCYATNPGNQCGYGGPTGDNSGEITCIQACIIAATNDGGVADDMTIGTCTNNCVTPKDSAGVGCGVVIGSQTSTLVDCLNHNCQPECFGG
jgi:hypothetical protein